MNFFKKLFAREAAPAQPQEKVWEQPAQAERRVSLRRTMNYAAGCLSGAAGALAIAAGVWAWSTSNTLDKDTETDHAKIVFGFVGIAGGLAAGGGLATYFGIRANKDGDKLDNIRRDIADGVVIDKKGNKIIPANIIPPEAYTRKMA